MRNILFVLTLLPLLSGCSVMGVYEGGFDCPAGSGVGCKSISEVNEMVNSGALSPQESVASSSLDEDPSDCTSCKSNTSKTYDGEIWWKDPLWFDSRLNPDRPLQALHLNETMPC